MKAPSFSRFGFSFSLPFGFLIVSFRFYHQEQLVEIRFDWLWVVVSPFLDVFVLFFPVVIVSRNNRKCSYRITRGADPSPSRELEEILLLQKAALLFQSDISFNGKVLQRLLKNFKTHKESAEAHSLIHLIEDGILENTLAYELAGNLSSGLFFWFCCFESIFFFLSSLCRRRRLFPIVLSFQACPAAFLTHFLDACFCSTGWNQRSALCDH